MTSDGSQQSLVRRNHGLHCNKLSSTSPSTNRCTDRQKVTEAGAKRRTKEPHQTTHDARVIDGTLALENQLVKSRKSVILSY